MSWPHQPVESEADRTQTRGYLLAWTRLGDLYTRGSLEEALTVALAMRRDFPARFAAVRGAQACLLCLLDRAEQAYAVANEVLERGSWWSPINLADPDLERLRTYPGFQEVRMAMAERYEDSCARAGESTATVSLLTPFSGPVRAAVVALHMRGVAASDTTEAWRSTTADGLLVALVESTVRDGDGLPCWDDDDLAARDVTYATTVVSERAPNAPLLLAGASQGAGHAIRLAVNGTVEGVRGFLGIVGATHIEFIRDALPEAASRGLRGYFLAGGDDTFVCDMQTRLAHEVELAGIACRLNVIDGLGHVFPENFGVIAADAVSFLLDEHS